MPIGLGAREIAPLWTVEAALIWYKHVFGLLDRNFVGWLRDSRGRWDGISPSKQLLLHVAPQFEKMFNCSRLVVRTQKRAAHRYSLFNVGPSHPDRLSS